MNNFKQIEAETLWRLKLVICGLCHGLWCWYRYFRDSNEFWGSVRHPSKGTCSIVIGRSQPANNNSSISKLQDELLQLTKDWNRIEQSQVIKGCWYLSFSSHSLSCMSRSLFCQASYANQSSLAAASQPNDWLPSWFRPLVTICSQADLVEVGTVCSMVTES